ncbi:MAG TPA: glycosyltransferase [Stellaceae bacterium]|nr:glycosyltransferase [Stellaceae bacterium]
MIGLEMFSAKEWIGGAIYLRNLVYTLAGLPPAEQPQLRLLYVDLAEPDLVDDLRKFAFVDPHLADRRVKSNFRLPRRAWGAAKRRAGWLFPAPQPDDLQVVYPGFGPAIPGTVHIHWIPDFQHLVLPEFFSAEECKRRTAAFTEIAAKRTMLFLSSTAALHDFQRFFPDALVAPRVWSFCSVFSERERGGRDPITTYQLPEKFAYVANQFWRHKDHTTLLVALARLRQRGLDISLVCTGLERDIRAPGYFDELMSVATELGVRHQVRTLGMVSRADQIEIFRHAAVVVQPSLFEGWSTVVEDAKALAAPILVSDLPVHREQTAGMQRAWTFKPRDPDALASRLAEIWPALPKRPDPAEEAAVAVAHQKRVVETGRCFTAAVRDALDRFGPSTSISPIAS